MPADSVIARSIGEGTGKAGSGARVVLPTFAICATSSSILYSVSSKYNLYNELFI